MTKTFPKQSAIKAQLAHYCGTDNYYRNPLAARVLTTDGCMAVAELCESHWLITDMQIVIHHHKKVKNLPFVSIEAKYTDVKHKKNNGEADTYTVFEVSYGDGNGNIATKQRYSSTDFPLESIKFFCAKADEKHMVLMLPSEY